MLEPEQRLFCYRLNQTPNGMVREGVSHRYTIMSLLGLHRFQAGGQRSLPVDTTSILDALLVDLEWIDNLGDLGLMLWLCALSRPEHLEEIYSRLDVRSALARFGGVRDGVTMEIAWFLSGLAHAALAGGRGLQDLNGIAMQTFSLLSANQGKRGIFGHQARNRSTIGLLRGRFGSFADQVYPIYALAKYAEAFQSRAALREGQNCADAICRAQGPLGQWWWHYDAVTGKVLQRYPVYAVHQHGMAPLALFAIGDAAGLDFSESIYKGLTWIYGNNELNIDLRGTGSNLVWRSIYRWSPAIYIQEFADYLRGHSSHLRADDFRIRFECRPYELGWLLYAFGGQHPGKAPPLSGLWRTSTAPEPNAHSG
jgi:hypothetical protein